MLIVEIIDNVKARMGRSSSNQAKIQKTLDLVKGALNYSDFSDVDMVIEVRFPECPCLVTILFNLDCF